MNTRWFSLRRRLLTWLLAGVTAGWLGAVGFAYVETREEVLEMLEKRGHDDKRLERHVHEELAEHLLKTMLTPLLFGLPILGAWIWFATRHGFRPLDQIAAEVACRTPDRLDPLAPEAAPGEIRPLIDAINDLFARLANSLEAERRFTSDAAHELRTPLAAIVTQAQVAARARDAAERDHALAQLVTGAQRARHLVEQLLTLARLDPAADLPMSELRLDRLAAEVCAEHGAAALEKNIALTLDAPQAVTLTGVDAMLRVLLRNLLDNAIRYTPAGGKVGVGVAARGGQIELRVADDGPGIPADQHAQALRRLHRLAGQDIEGCGLGLSIVARIAELHHARLEMGEGLEGRGLSVTVKFGA
ncbi:ATP-binding protein [Sulfuricystis multivorans]|uniref:ATP-binding protein n=1 Tax=Sulfuricystis multivorans TaxID=2211108 RepID=UPI000F81C9D3|nr:ATP-binding protein [Sulfuricystis multivorans]